jgi:two-component system chemotaxis response regulator CheY
MPKKVIIVDDSRVLRQVVRLALEAGGYEVVEAQDGVEGLRQMAAHPDAALVISDVNMPRMDGMEMLEAARQDPVTAGLKFVMVTTEAEPEVVRRGKALGAKGWIVKPFKADLLVAAVHRLVGDP